jgi:hypothetical protein
LYPILHPFLKLWEGKLINPYDTQELAAALEELFLD